MPRTQHRDRWAPFRALAPVCLALATALSSFTISPTADAAEPTATAPATLVVITDSPASAHAVGGLGAKLPAPWRLGDDAAARKSLAASGQRAIGKSLANSASRSALAKKAHAAAADAGAQAVLFVHVTPKRAKRGVTLLLVAPNDSGTAVDTTIEVDASDDGAAVLEAIRSTLTRLASEPPSAASPTPASATSNATEPPAAAPSTPPPDDKKPLGGPNHSVLVFAAGGGSGSRFFSYHDGRTPELRSYSLAAAPNLVLSAELYPLARTSLGVARGLGVYGGFQRAVGVSSQTSTGTSVGTTWYRGEGGVRLRLSFGDDGRFIVAPHAGLVKERFGFNGDATLTSFLPDVDYLFWSLGLDGRVRVGPIALLANASYLPAIANGELAARFRETSFAAIELGGGLAIPLARIFELRATAEYSRVFYTFKPAVGDLYVAGGALDQFIRAELLATLML